MAKKITRTITVYTYTTAKVNFASGKVEDVVNHQYPYKLNQRQRNAIAKEAGNPIVAETTGTALYAMSIEDFVKYAKPVTGEEAAELAAQDD